MNEKELKEIGEKIAEAAARANVGAKQMRELYRITKTRSIPYLEAHIKRQIPRAGRRGGPIGLDKFGPVMLEVIESFEEDKRGLQKVLEYANMLYEYIKMTLVMGEIKDEGLREKLIPIVRETCSRFGYEGITLQKERGRLICRIRLRRFSGNPADLASEIYQEVISRYPDLTQSIRFWIETRGRR